MSRCTGWKRIILLRVSLLFGILLPIFAQAQSSAADQVFNWRFAIYFPTMDSVEAQKATAFVNAVAKESNNRLQIKIFPGGLLGFSSFTNHRAVADGVVEMGTTMSAAMVEAPEWETLSFPMLFKTRDHVKEALDVAAPDLHAATSRVYRSKVLGIMVPGFDHMMSKMPLRTVEDWKGKKFRSWQKQLACWFEQMGATPMIIPFGEAYTALATGVVSGNSNILRVGLESKFHEVMKYVSTGWLPNTALFVTLVSEKAWNSLPADLQDILARHAAQYVATTGNAYWDFQAKEMEQLIAKGMQTVPVAAEELEKGREKALVCVERWRQQTTPQGAALLKKLMSLNVK